MDLSAILIKYQKKTIIEYPNELQLKPLVSVCVQTYQHELLIEECLEGILMQKTDFDFEILLGEDDSSDSTRDICIQYANQNPNKIRLFLHNRENKIKINGKLTGRFNFLHNLKEAKGKYIALCDGDDYWTDPHKLQKQIDFLEANPDYAIHSGNACYLNYKNDENIYAGHESNTFDINDFITRNNLITLTVMFRKPTFQEISLLKKNIYGDWALYVLILKEKGYKALRTNEVFGVYRKHSGSLTSTMNTVDQMERMIEQILFNVRYLNHDKFDVYNQSLAELRSFKNAFSKKLKTMLTQLLIQITINKIKVFVKN